MTDLISVSGQPQGSASRGGVAKVYAAEGAAADFANAFFGLVMAAFITAAPVIAHLAHPAAGILTALLLGGLCAWRMPQISILAIVFALMFQNLFVSLVAGQIDGEADFDFIRGYNFALLSVTWLVCVAKIPGEWRDRNPAIDPFVKVSAFVLATLGVHFLIGFALYGTTAVVYLRNIVTPLLLFHVCLLTFLRQSMRLGLPITLLSALIVVCGFFEFLFRQTWLAVTNGYAYWELAMGPNYSTLAFDKTAKETGRVMSGLLDTFAITLFNSPLLEDFGAQIMRLLGPNMHAISFAYALCFLAIFALYRGRVGMTAALLALLVLTSAKGPLILFLLVAISWTLSRLFGARFAFAVHCLALVAYAALGIVIGLSIGDYHVLGLMAGLYDFFSYPLGSGIGAGGNFSSEFELINWSEAQALGRTPFPVESAVGVLIHQIGIFAVAVIGAYLWISWRLLLVAQRTGNSLHAAAAFALATMVATGLFQEEAYFSPLALGLFTALAGMIIGASLRTNLLR